MTEEKAIALVAYALRTVGGAYGLIGDDEMKRRAERTIRGWKDGSPPHRVQYGSDREDNL